MPPLEIPQDVLLHIFFFLPVRDRASQLCLLRLVQKTWRNAIDNHPECWAVFDFYPPCKQQLERCRQHVLHFEIGFPFKWEECIDHGINMQEIDDYVPRIKSFSTLGKFYHVRLPHATVGHIDFSPLGRDWMMGFPRLVDLSLSHMEPEDVRRALTAMPVLQRLAIGAMVYDPGYEYTSYSKAKPLIHKNLCILECRQDFRTLLPQIQLPGLAQFITDIDGFHQQAFEEFIKRHPGCRRFLLKEGLCTDWEYCEIHEFLKVAPVQHIAIHWTMWENPCCGSLATIATRSGLGTPQCVIEAGRLNLDKYLLHKLFDGFEVTYSLVMCPRQSMVIESCIQQAHGGGSTSLRITSGHCQCYNHIPGSPTYL
ncbi:hypothetical protein CVT24_005844 [Panaeolus cyanescens]|uniref:F-box domain-containing protein n=1 Tax=Panaeolus cyanescens TaxID=181874 RepID=A0A409X550_9AGAR|nr:hypothetical protein CVT24_005844 [Panaeolus cyanescens]